MSTTTLTFEKDGIELQVLTPLGLEFKKNLLGQWKATCPKCETSELELGEQYLHETNPSSARLPGWELVKNGKKVAKIFEELPDQKHLCHRWRERNKANKIRDMGATDEESWEFTLTCTICNSDFHLTTIAKNLVQYLEPSLLDDLRAAVPIERDSLTMKCLARISVVRGEKPETYITRVEKTLADSEKIDGYLQKFTNLIAEGKAVFVSGTVDAFIGLMQTDLETVTEQLKKELNDELNKIIKEIFDASWVVFTEEEDAKKDNFLQKAVNKLTGQDGVLLVAQKETKPSQ
jgi:hypothetical protein